MLPSRPTPPIALATPVRNDGRLATTTVNLDDRFLAELTDLGIDVSLDRTERLEASRDWWPQAMTWSRDGQVPAVAAAIVRPTEPDQVPALARLCHDHRIPLTVAGGRSGVMGGSVPVFGGVLLDLCGLRGVRSVDTRSGVVEVAAGTFGVDLEESLRSGYGLTLGHWPQSIALSTVGGWLACRGAGQFSTRYGKIEDMVIGLDVVLADGTRLTTGEHSHRATGPDLTQLFVGSEGTLGIITSARLRAHDLPSSKFDAAFAFREFSAGADTCRRIVRRGGSPAALRLYDEAESSRSHGIEGACVLLVHDEGDEEVMALTRRLIEQECSDADRLDESLTHRWLEHRNDVSALEALISRGYLVDTMEMTVRWSAVDGVHLAVIDSLRAVPGVIAASVHLSHSYPDAACLYFTVAGRPEQPEQMDDLYRQVWESGTNAALANGASLSHHHGIGLARGRFLSEALGAPAHRVLTELKSTLDPHGILNPGKLGLAGPFGDPPVPPGGSIPGGTP